MKKESFLKGTVILVCANTVSKILGAVLKIPLSYILGEEGMAIYHTAFSVYIMLLAFVTSGLPFALSKYISGQLAEGNRGSIRIAIRISVWIMGLFGLFGSLIMFFGSDFFALSMKDPKAPLAIRAISPSVFLVALGAVFKSCYQGYSSMTPTAVSQVLESFVKLIAGYLLASGFAAFSVTYSSAAAIFGVTLGEAFATLILILLYIPFAVDLKKHTQSSRIREIAKDLASVAVPMTCVSVISGGIGLIETSVIRSALTAVSFTEQSAVKFICRYSPYTNLFNNLASSKKLSFDGARWLFGAYSGYAMTVFNLPVGILASFGVSLLPIVAGCITLNDRKKLEGFVSSASKIMMSLSVLCSIYLYIFSPEILNALFKNTAASSLLKISAPLVIINTMCQLVASIEYASGNISGPFISGSVAGIVQIILCFILIRIPSLNITGVIVASYFSDTLQLILNCLFLKKQLNIFPINPLSFVKVTFSGLISGFIALLLYAPIKNLLCKELYALIISLAVSFCAYLIMIFGFDIIKKEEILKLSKA